MTTAKLEIGQRINTSDDTGIVDAIDGDRVTIRWNSGVVTTQPARVLLAAAETDEDSCPKDTCDWHGEGVLVDDEFWTIRTFGPRYFTATRKYDGEHRIYYSRDALERDFSSILM